MTSRATLHEKHLDELYASGLTDSTIEAAGLYTLERNEDIKALLGWAPAKHDWGLTLVFPFRGANGYVRVKPSFPRTNGKGGLVKYEAPKGEPNRAYFPPGFEGLNTPDTPLVITEGLKQTLAVSQQGIACIGLTGVWGWQEKRQRSDAGKAYGDLPDTPALYVTQLLGLALGLAPKQLGLEALTVSADSLLTGTGLAMGDLTG